MKISSQDSRRTSAQAALSHAVAPVLALLLAVTPVLAQQPAPINRNLPPRPLPAGGIPKSNVQLSPAVAAARALATYRQSFEVSFDGTQWGTQLNKTYYCVPATNSPGQCSADEHPLTVYTRWTAVNVEADQPSVAPYRIFLKGGTSTNCATGTPRGTTTGYPVSISPGMAAVPGTIVCSWAVQAVTLDGTPGPGENQQYKLEWSNTATITLTLKPVVMR